MNSKRLSRMQAHSQPAKSSLQEAHTTEAFSPDTAPASQTHIMHMQHMIGNQGVQRLLANGGLMYPRLQRQPESQDTNTSSAFTAKRLIFNFAGGIFVGNADFQARARRKNEYYAAHPPKPDWPYSDNLKALWSSERYEEFANEVGRFQHFTLRLPESETDGVLGPQTSKALTRHLGSMQAPGTTGDATATTPETTPGAQAPVTKPVADGTAPTPALDPATQMPIAAPTPAPGTTAPTVDPAVQNHPAVARIVIPVKTAFDAYKAAETAHNTATNAASSAKPAEKATKVAAQEAALITMQDERAKASAAMAAARSQVAALNSGEFSGSNAMLNQVRALINQQLNENTIYYTQGTNANILHKDGWTAGMRTCNMTVMAMMLEAVGKSAADYSGADLTETAAQYKDQLGMTVTRQDDLKKLRLPDFMQLVAINLTGSREAAAASITSHGFITKVARAFGLHLTEIKKGQTQGRAEDANWFLSTKHSQMLNTVGSLYQPAKMEAVKALVSDSTYKKLRGHEKEAYQQNAINTATEAKRVQYVDNVTGWIEVDTFLKAQMTMLETVLNTPDSETQKPRPYEAVREKVDETLAALKAYETELTQKVAKSPALKGKLKDVKALITALENAQSKGKAKPTDAPKALRALFDGKGSDDPLAKLNANLKKYESLKKVYETLATSDGIEKLIPLNDYKREIMATMSAAIGGGNQVMVNLDNHFVRLQSVNDDGIVIDDPGNRGGENNRVSWNDARKYGYFQHYLLVAP